MKRIQKVLIVLCLLGCLICLILQILFYFGFDIGNSHQNDQIENFFGYVQAYFLMLSQEAVFKLFTCVMLFICVGKYYMIRMYLKKQNSYNMAFDLIWKVTFAAVICTIEACIALGWFFHELIVNFSSYKASTVLIVYGMAMLGGMMVTLSILWVFYQIVKHTKNEYQKKIAVSPKEKNKFREFCFEENSC